MPVVVFGVRVGTGRDVQITAGIDRDVVIRHDVTALYRDVITRCDADAVATHGGGNGGGVVEHVAGGGGGAGEGAALPGLAGLVIQAGCLTGVDAHIIAGPYVNCAAAGHIGCAQGQVLGGL